MKRIQENIAALFFYLCCTLALTFPLVKYLNKYLGGDHGDGWQCLWNYWWVNKAVVGLRENPYFTKFIFYPTGHTLVFHGLNISNGLLSIPLQYFFDLVTTYNLILIFTFVLTGFNMFLLLRYLSGNVLAAFIGGFIFTFCPHRMGQALGHMPLMTIEWAPLYILYFIRTQKEGGLKNILLAALFLVLTELSSDYFFLFFLMFTVLYLLFFGIREKCLGRSFKRFLPIILLTMIILSPVFWMMITESRQGQFFGAHPPEPWSADLLSFIVPGEIQTLGWFFKPITSVFTGNTSENSNYIGYTVLFFIFFAIKRLWRKDLIVPFLTWTAFFFLVLSLGMHLHVKGHIIKVPLPYFFMHRFLSFISFSGVPERFFIMTMFCLAILASLGIKEILEWPGKKRVAVISFGIFLLFVEYLALPFTISNYPGMSMRCFDSAAHTPTHMVPEFYKKLSRDKQDYAILDVNAGRIYERRAVNVLYYQTIHNKRILYGYISRIRKDAVDFLINIPGVLNILRNENVWGVSPLIVQNAFKYYRIKYVIVPRAESNLMYPENRMVEQYGFKKVFEDEQIFAYKVY